MSLRFRLSLLPVVLAFSLATAFAKVAPVPFNQLVRQSSVIVLARVESVKPRLLRPLGDRYARARVIEVWKGPANLAKIEFLASPTWTCDIADAQVGETAVLFLQWDARENRYNIAHSGRGRMAIREITGTQLATIWRDVRLPEGTATEAGPEPQFDFIRSIAVPVLKKLVVEATSSV